MTPYILHYAPDNASLIIRLALEEMDLPYETRLVDRSAKAQQSSTYLALNPAGHIPTLETPFGPISETAAILLWLADAHSIMAPTLDAPDRGSFLKWLFFMSNTLQAGLRITFYPQNFIGPNADHHTALRTQMQITLRDHLRLLDHEAGQDHSWFGGAQVSVFDYYVVTCLRWCALYPQITPGWFRLAEFPNLHRLAIHLEARVAVQAMQQAEGLGTTPFSAPQLPQPPEGCAV